jgi:steroid delta-isomerase-like uncharacterized protein
MSEENKRLVRRLIDEVWNQGRLEVLGELVTSDFVRHDPSWPDEACGLEGFKQYAATVHTACPDGRFTIEDMIAEGDKVGVRWTFQGTHQGEFFGVPPTWKEIKLAGVTLLCVREGKFVEAWNGYDALSLMHQLGVVP